MTATPEQLQQVVAGIDADLAALDSDYAALVAQLAAGDKHALAKADQLDQRRSVLIRSKAMNIAAAGLLQQQLEQERVAAENEAKRQIAIEAAEGGVASAGTI